MLTREEVLRIAKLSKLEFSNEELENIEVTLNQIFEYMKEIDEVNVDNVEPLYNVLEIQDRTRADVVNDNIEKIDFLNNAPEKDDDFVILPRIV